MQLLVVLEVELQLSVVVAFLATLTVKPWDVRCAGPVHVVALAPSEERAPAVPA